MIEKIEETLSGNTLTVSVVCSVRKFAVHPIKLLTTEKLIDIINDKYTNITLIKSPNHPVGNTNRKKISNVGTWIFEAKLKEEKIEKPKTRSTKKPKQPKTTSSIRGRISKLATTKEN